MSAGAVAVLDLSGLFNFLVVSACGQPLGEYNVGHFASGVCVDGIGAYLAVLVKSVGVV